MQPLDEATLKGALQERAARLLLAIGDKPAKLSSLFVFSDTGENSTRKAVLWLRDRQLVHICGYSDDDAVEMILLAGAGKDAPRPKRIPGRGHMPKPASLAPPPPDPLLSALYQK